jgi:drug/metabolite transporter (DMT)-like permease
MSIVVFLAVLTAALLHASWNVIVKVGLDRFSSILLLTLMQAAIALPILPLVQQPATSAWPWIIASALLHTGYKIFLIRAYHYGDLSQVYPIARGAAPMIVALVSVFFLGEPLTATGLAAVIVIASGVAMMSLRGGGQLGRMSPTALIYALGTAAMTSSYTLVDGIGARVAGSASGFILWMVIGDAIGMMIFAAIARGPSAFSGAVSAWKGGIAAGAMSLGSYWIAVWAFTQAPIALVAALRESSVLFAMVIAATVLRERATRWRWAAAGAIVCGIALVRM